MHTSAFTSTTPGQVYTIGNQVYSTPGQTTLSVTTTQEDLVWVRTPGRRETSWTFTGGRFKVRPGQLISAIALPAGAGNSSDFLLAYNHTTGQLEQFSRLNQFHATRGGWAWLAVTLAGSIGFAMGFAVSLGSRPDPAASPLDRLLSPVVDWIMGATVSAVVAFFVVNGAKARLWAQRNAAFQRQYLPGLRQFLEETTPALQKLFARRAAA